MTRRIVTLAVVVVITTATPAEAAPARQTVAGATVAAPGTRTGESPAEARPAGARAVAEPADVTAGANCDAGSFCAWSGADYTGKAVRLNLETATPNQCVTLPDKLVAKSLANLMTRDVAVYEAATCSTEAEFTTYPKGGTYVPDAPFVVRAIQVWE